MTLPYDKIFSRVLNKINDPKELSLDESDLLEIYTERLHSAIGNPRVRRLFSSITLDDEIQEMTFTLNNSVDEYADEDFILEVLTLGMTIEWLQPQVDSRIYTAEAIGGKEEKMLQNNYKPMQTRLEKLETKLNKMICNYGYMYNSYIRGD
jgi:hypothetical protein